MLLYGGVLGREDVEMSNVNVRNMFRAPTT